jgi:hypothetical protein
LKSEGKNRKLLYIVKWDEKIGLHMVGINPTRGLAKQMALAWGRRNNPRNRGVVIIPEIGG